MKLSKQGADFIKSFEGCRLEAYHGAANEFPKWCRANGKVVAGLQRRENV